MRILAIELKNYRGIADRRVEFLSDGITVVEGPNEAGKTSIPEAIGLIFEVKDGSKSQNIRDIHPVTGGNPSVTLEMRTGDHHFTYSKQWGSGRGTTLTIHEPTRESLTGEVAHDRAHSIFHDTVDQNLWSALQQQQGSSMVPPVIGAVTALHDALSEASGGDATHDAHDDLMVRVQEEYEKYWTPRGGRWKGDIDKIRLRFEAAREHRVSTEFELAAVDQLLSDHDANSQQLAESRTKLLTARETLADLHVQIAALSSLKQERSQTENDQKMAKAALEVAAAALEKRETLITEVVERRTAVDEAKADVARFQSLLDGLTGSSPSRIDDPLHDSGAAAIDVSRATAAVAWHGVNERLTALTEHQATVKRLKAERDAMTVDRETLAAIESVQGEVLGLTARLSAGVSHLQVEVLGDHDVSVDGAAWDESDPVAVVATTTVEAAGVVRVTITPDERAQDLQSDLDEQRTELEQLLGTAGVTSVEDARACMAEREAISEQLTSAEGELKGLAAGDSVDALQELAEDHARTADQLIELDVAECRERLVRAEAALAEAKESDRLTAEARSSVRIHTDLYTEEREKAQAALTTLSGRLAAAEESLVTAREQQTDEHVRDETSRCETKRTEAEAALAEVSERLDQAGATELEQNREDQEAIVTSTEKRVADHRTRDVEIRAQLAMLGDKGLKDQAVEAASAEERTQREWESTLARAEAARLLWETFDSHATEARLQYIDPYRQKIVSVGRMVHGPDFDVTVDDSLKITHRTLAGVTVPFESLSGGAREQLAIIARVATAALTSTTGGAPVILDDALGHSDPSRQRQIGSMMRRMAQENTVQIIILTCEPSRYDTLGEVSRVSLV